MVVRVAVVVLVCSSFAYAQRERFSEEDLNKWALISRIATDFTEFGLTSNQLDELKINDIRLGSKIYSFRGQPSSAAEFLDKVYEVLNDEQEARLHQIMFQRWMNRDDLATPLKAFAPGEVQHLGAKLKTLKQKISRRLDETIAKLPAKRDEQPAFLRTFLQWRWEQQVNWLRAELGEERTKQLLGQPAGLGYTFITKGDRDAMGATDAVGEPYGGGNWYGAGVDGWGSMNGVETVSVSLDPATGEAVNLLFRRRPHGKRRPVDLPDDLTLSAAFEKLEALEKGMRQTFDEAALEIQELRDFRNPANGANRRAQLEEARKREKALEEELAIMDITKEKLRVMIQKLGGDPDAESKAITQARRLFQQSVLLCNRQPFVSHIDAHATQCDQLDAIWDKYAGVNGSISKEREEDYYADVMKVLDAKQKRLFRQQLFRRYWFSRDCGKAFSLTKVKLTNEQKAEVANLARSLAATEKAIQGNRIANMGRYRGVHLSSRFGFGSRDQRNRDDEPYVFLEKLFTEVLEGLTGKNDAGRLLGQPMEFDQDWKRPVVVPDGLTLQSAKERFVKLVEEEKRLREQNDPREFLEGDGGRVPILAEPKLEEALRMRQLNRQVRIAKRIVEELGGSTDDH